MIIIIFENIKLNPLIYQDDEEDEDDEVESDKMTREEQYLSFQKLLLLQDSL
jgi:hypothetical protein